MNDARTITVETNADNGWTVTINHPSVSGLLIAHSDTEAEALAFLRERLGRWDERPAQPELGDLAASETLGLGA